MIAGDIVKLNESDLDEGFFEHSSNLVDKSIGYLIATIIVIGFFIVYLAGMARVHFVSSEPVEIHQLRLLNGEPRVEIGDAAEEMVGDPQSNK